MDETVSDVAAESPRRRTRLKRHELVVRACHLLDEADAPIPLQQLAERLGVSAAHFHRVFRELLGVTPKDYSSALQAERARDALKQGSSVTDAAFSAGFESLGRFYARAHRMLGMAPSTYRLGGAGMIIAQACVQTRFGMLQVAATERGVCRVGFGEHEMALMDELRQRFPAAILEPGGRQFQHTVDVVAEATESHTALVDLPLDIHGTAFQIQVWQTLQGIPRGQVRSYGQISDSLGRPAAHRAVASACASNQCALVIPCHRVVRSDGHPGGYRWGEQRKQALLASEARDV